MLKPLGQRELDAIRDDPIYFDGDHPDHDAYVAMVDGEYRRVYSPGLQQAMLKQDRPRLGPAAIQIKRTIGPDTARNDPNDVKVLKDAFDGLGAFDMGTKRKPGDASEDSKIRAAICGFQRAHGLKADCEVTPNGPTLKALRVAAAESNEEVPPVPRSKPPAPRDVWPPVPQRKPRPPAGDPGAIFLAGIRGAENSLLKSVHPVTAARGLHQITPGKLMDIGAPTPEGAWNPSYYPGIETVDDFTKPENPHARPAQEKAMLDVMRLLDRRLRRKGAYDHVGQEISGIVAPFTITESALRAAAHRRGATGVRQYLDHLRKHGWASDASQFPEEHREKFLAIDTRLRTFQDIPYK